MAQDAVNRWWWPSLMMFGPPRRRLAPHRAVDGVEDQAGDQRRSPPAVRRHDGSAVPSSSGSTVPDPDLRWNEERGHYDFGDIDWDEFWNVVKGNGPMNRERMAHKNRAWDDGDWVREAATAHAAKQAARRSSSKSA